MNLFFRLILCSLITYSLIDIDIKFFSNQPQGSEFTNYFHIMWQFFKWPLIFTLIYGIWTAQIIQRLHRTNFPTNIDIIIISVLLGNVAYWIEGNKSILQFSTITLILYFLWLMIRKYKAITDEPENTSHPLYSGTPSEVDELNREIVGEQITDAIRYSKIGSSFVLAITASWGEGKSTLMSFITKRLNKTNSVICHSFDPWYFNTQEALINSFFKSLYEKLNEEKVFSNYSFLFSKYAKLINGSSTNANIVLKAIGSLTQYSDQVEMLKKELGECLVKVDKKVVIFIDNIDRLDKNELFLMFKLVNLCCDFSNIMFILLYDKTQVLEKMNDNNSDEYGKKYLEKIINAEIVLPIADPILVVKYWERLLSPLKEYIDTMGDDNSLKFNIAITHISSLIKNIRIAKNHANWINLKVPFLKRNHLNFSDFFIIESISFFFPEMYQNIFTYKQHFPYYSEYDDLTIFQGTERINEIRKKIYEELIPLSNIDPEKEVLSNLIGLLFQGVKNYINKSDNYWGGDEGKEGHYQTRPIDNSRYLLSYFSFVPTQKLDLAVSLDNIISKTEFDVVLNQDAERAFSEFVKKVADEGLLYELMTYIRNSLLQINTKVYPFLIKAFYDNSTLFSYESGFLTLAEHSRAEALVASLLRNYKDPDQLIAFEDLVLNCKELNFIRGVLYFYSEDYNFTDDAYAYVKSKFSERVNTIIEQQVNIFELPNNYRDFWSLVDHAENNKIRDYIVDVLSKHIESVPVFLDLFIQRIISSASGEIYNFNKKEYQNLVEYISEEEISKFVNQYLECYASDPVPRSIDLFRRFKEGVADKSDDLF